MKIAKVIFWIAGIWGVVVITPLFFLLDTVNRQSPPAITHPEYYYGFVSVGFAFQIVFLLIASDPARFRPIIIPSVVEKLGYTSVVFALYAQGRLDARMLLFGGIDFLLGLAFLLAFFKTRTRQALS